MENRYILQNNIKEFRGTYILILSVQKRLQSAEQDHYTGINVERSSLSLDQYVVWDCSKVPCFTRSIHSLEVHNHNDGIVLSKLGIGLPFFYGVQEIRVSGTFAFI